LCPELPLVALFKFAGPLLSSKRPHFRYILNYWGHTNGDDQMIRNAEYLKTNFLDQGKMGLSNGQGYYNYPDPAYQRTDFLAVPDKSCVSAVVSIVSLANQL